MSQKLKVALLFGGNSGEHEISLLSANSIRLALDPEKYELLPVAIDKKGRWFVSESELPREQELTPQWLASLTSQVSLLPWEAPVQLIRLQASSLPPLQFDVLFSILHGPNGEDGTMQGLLELAQVPYVGSGVLGSALGMDKELAKRLFAAAQIPVVPFQVLQKVDFQADAASCLKRIHKHFSFPYFVKPANMGSSVGVAKVKSANEAQAMLAEAFQYDTKILIEESIAARELECAILGNHHPQASVVGEIIPQHEFYSYEAKYLDQDGALLQIPAQGLTDAQHEQIRAFALKAFQALECRGLARVDFFLDRNNGKIYLNEVNTLPGFTSISMYPKLWEASGLPYGALLDQLITLACERHAEKKALKTSYTPPSPQA